MGRRNAILGVVAIVAILAGVGAWAAFRRPTKLNVLLITVDTLRADHVGAYGYRRATTPNLDALAAESKVFRLAFSQAPETNPSLASVMTCLYPHETTVYRNFHLLPSKPRTLAEILAARGLATGAVVTNFSLRRGSGLERGLADYDDRMDDLATPKWEGIERIAPKTTAAAVEWLRGHAGERFFLWVHYMDPHAPYMPPPPYDTMFPVRDPGDTGPDITLPFLEGGLGIGGIPLYAQLGDHNDPRYYASQYDGEIRFFDHWLGELLKEVRAQGLLDRTLIVVAADHGEGMGEYGYWFNHPEFLWNGLIHVPLVVRLPGEARHEEIATPVALSTCCRRSSRSCRSRRRRRAVAVGASSTRRRVRSSRRRTCSGWTRARSSRRSSRTTGSFSSTASIRCSSISSATSARPTTCCAPATSTRSPPRAR